MIIPVIIGTKGTMKTALKKKLEAMQVKQLVDSLQKAAKL
jgi:transcription antitermination factor NusG